MEHKKEHARFDWSEMIVQSWTYHRLTDEERKRFFMSVDHAEHIGAIKGDYYTRYTILQALYSTHLMALGYEWCGWRDPNGEELKF